MAHDSYGNTPNDRLPLGKAFIWILISTLLISGTATMGWLYYLHVQKQRANDDANLILGVVQTGPEKEALKTVYLSELLDLSVDHPTNIYSFSTKEATKKLLRSPLIKQAKVKRVRPGTVYIDYVVRRPVAYLADYVNVAVDEEGFIFPVDPFLTPKRLPELFLGLPPFEGGADPFGREGGRWNHPLRDQYFTLALEIHHTLASLPANPPFVIKRIDVSHAYAESYGQRQIVVFIEERMEKVDQDRTTLLTYPRYLRLSTANYAAELSDYMLVRKQLAEQNLAKNDGPALLDMPNTPMTIDFRIARLAFVKEEIASQTGF